MIPLGIHALYSLVTFLITSSNTKKNTVQITLHILPGDFTTCIFIFIFFPNPSQLDIWNVRNQLRPRPKWKAGKIRYITLKSASFAFDTAHYKGRGKSHCIPDPWKKRKKEKKKKIFWNGLLGGIQSGTSRGIDGTAPGHMDTWPGQDRCWAHISGYWPRPLGAPKPCCLKKNWWAWQHIWARYGFYFSRNSPRCYRPSATYTAAPAASAGPA